MLNTVLPAVARMRARRSGQIVLMSSLGAIAPPTNLYMTPYLASKAAVKFYAEGLRAGLAAEQVGVQVVLSGFVDSNMTQSLQQQNTGPWPPPPPC